MVFSLRAAFLLGLCGFMLGAQRFPLLGRPLAVAADVHHHAHLGQQQDQTGAARREEGQADAGVGQGVGDHCDVAEHLPGDLCHDADAHHRAVEVFGPVGDP